MMQRWIVAALATIALLAPAGAFLAAVPSSARVVRRSLTSSSSLGFDSATAATARPLNSRRGAPLFMSAQTAVDQKGLVTVYHKDTCPHCKKALALLEEGYSLQVTRVDVLEGDDSEKKIKQMKTFSGRDTVPQIFFNSEHLGGNDDLQKLHEEGKLEDLVVKVRAEAPGMMKPTWYHPWY